MAEIMDDEEFNKFCAALKAEKPDLDVIKAGMEKYGTGQLSEAQKAQFLTAMFPEPVVTGNKENNGLGFRNMTGIKNALEAMNALKAEGKVDDKAMLQILTETNPKGGRNVMTTIAVNTRAAEYRMDHASNEEMKNILSEKIKVLSAIQESLKQVDDDVLAKAVCTPDDSQGVGEVYVKKIKYKDIAERAINQSDKQKDSGISKDTIMRENFERIRDKIEKIEEERARQEAENVASAPNTEALNVENADGTIKIGGTPSNQALNVEKDDEDNVGTVTPAPNEDPDQNKHIDFKGIKEQDIIDYMFNEWFLASLNWGAEKLVNGLNDGLHNAIRPRSPAPAGATKKEAKHLSAMEEVLESHQNTINWAQSDGIINSLSQQINENVYSPAEITSVFERTLDDIKLHKGKDPKDWTPCKAVDPVRHARLIKEWNAKYREDPEAFNKLIEERKTAIKAIAPKQLAEVSEVAATFAFLKHVSKKGKVDKKLSNSARKKIYSESKLFITNLLKTSSSIQKAELAQYLHEHPELAPNTPFERLSPEAQAEIGQRTGEKFGKYLSDTSNTSAEVMEYVITGVTAESADAKKEAVKKLKESYQKIKDITDGFGQELPDEEPARRQERTDQKPKNLREEGEEQVKSEEREKKITNDLETQKKIVQSEKEESNKRSSEFKKGKKRVLDNRSVSKKYTLANLFKDKMQGNPRY